MEKLNKIAVVPDVHGKDFWKEAKNDINSLDKIIFLGDYLDSYSSIDQLSRVTLSTNIELKNFQEILKFKMEFPEKVILMLGNHDIGYLLELGCSRQASYETFRTYQKLFWENINHFKLTEYVELKNENVFLSHAGITRDWINLVQKRIEINPSLKTEILKLQLTNQSNELDINVPIEIDTKTIIDGFFNKLLLNLNQPQIKSFLSDILWTVAPIRGGSSHGSIIWADRSEWENEKNIFGENIKQIVGHSRHYFPTELAEGVLCIDLLAPKVYYL